MKPREGETMYMYLVISAEAVSSVLVQEGEKGVQRPIYYVRRVLHDSEMRYSWVEKMVYAFVNSVQ